MDFGEVIRIWRRRAMLTAALVLAAMVAGVVALVALPATYQAQASVVLLASKSAAQLTGGNPYLSFTSSLSLAADVVTRALTAPQTAQQLARGGFTDSYAVGPPAYTTTTTGSVLVISVSGDNQVGAEATLQAVIGQVRKVLVQIQAGLPRRDRITDVTLSSSPDATLATSASLRPVVMTVIVALLLALSAPVVIDGVLRRRASQATLVPGTGTDTQASDFTDDWTKISAR
ncbi:MAG TPA: hypothetical protein VMR14_23055 [Streptosporangiaceae bacterium]|jgi:capsular polysaccharide biosynthesis protein|nr:hypothetical protein [Streptosporangiaceae bacterium]